MPKLKLTKGELKRQRDSLEQFKHYLPTLQLKKQQLQIKIQEARKVLDDKKAALKTKEQEIELWVGLLADPAVKPFLFAWQQEHPSQHKGLKEQESPFSSWFIPKDVVIDSMNIAGVNAPFLKEVQFESMAYDFFSTPLWVDRGLVELRNFISLLVEVRVIEEQIRRLARELRITTQRVNLFEKVKIPGCLENIRKIRIYLGDQMANAVGISKVAKNKIELTAVGS